MEINLLFNAQKSFHVNAETCKKLRENILERFHDYIIRESTGFIGNLAEVRGRSLMIPVEIKPNHLVTQKCQTSDLSHHASDIRPLTSDLRLQTSDPLLR